MQRVYRVPFNGTVTAAGGDTDLVVIQPADDKPCRIIGWIVGQETNVSDANEKELRLTLRHMTATVTVTGGSSITPVANRPGTNDIVAAGFTATSNCTTVATTTGTSTIMENMAWNNRNSPWERWIPEELRPTALQTEALLVRLETTLSADTVMDLTFFVEEGF